MSGEVPDWRQLAHRTEEEITSKGIHLLLNHTAKTIDTANHEVLVVNSDGQENQLRYDRLILATGSAPVRPPLRGIELSGVYHLRTMEDSFAINEYLRTYNPRSAVIIGGGYIGMEMADALTHRGLAVAIVEHGESVLKTVDQSLSQIVSDELHRHHIQLITSVRVEGISKIGTKLSVIGSQGFWVRIDVFATALFHNMSIDDLNHLDLSYTPPVSSPWDPVQLSAQAWVKQCPMSVTKGDAPALQN